MANEMRRGRSQTIWRHMPESTFRYNANNGWCKVTGIGIKEKESLPPSLVDALNHTLKKWNAFDQSVFPDPVTKATSYTVGTPDHVDYSLWPLVFECSSCRRVQYYRDITRLKEKNDRLVCWECKKSGKTSKLQQLPYVYICECGRVSEPYVAKCWNDGTHPIKLVNNGNFQDSYWFCMKCNLRLSKNAREGLGVRKCECGKIMRGVTLLDTRMYFSQTLQLVDISPKALERWQENSHFSDFLIGAALRIAPHKKQQILDLRNYKPESDSLPPEVAAIVKKLVEEKGMTEAEALAFVGSAAKSTNIWGDYKTALTKLDGDLGAQKWNEVRGTREYVFVRDDASMDSLQFEMLEREAETQGDTKALQRLKQEQKLALELGLVNLQVAQNLPILLAGYGYTRHSQTPADNSGASGTEDKKQVVLRPFPSVDKKVPIYVARNTTEGFLFELDPWRLAAFLKINLGVVLPDGIGASEDKISAWLLGKLGRLVTHGESHLELKWFEQEAGLTIDAPSALTFGLLHSLSHVLKATAHLYVGVDNDSVAEYLFPHHFSGLLYISSHVEFNLGGLSSVFRSNMTQWLGSCKDFASRCSFDPVCIDGGGACLACLYTKFGCTYFNRTLSRSFLVGGQVKGYAQPVIGYWEAPVVQLANELRKQVAHK